MEKPLITETDFRVLVFGGSEKQVDPGICSLRRGAAGS
jgi:hypothetical protein